MNDYPMEVYKLFFKWFEANHLPTALLAKAHDGAAIVKMNAASESYLAGYMQAKQEVDEVHDAEPLDLTDSLAIVIVLFGEMGRILKILLSGLIGLTPNK
jgi:hypothetical protein